MDEEQKKVYQDQLAAGKSEVFAREYASQIAHGELYAGNFATIREKRYAAKLKLAKANQQKVSGGDGAKAHPTAAAPPTTDQPAPAKVVAAPLAPPRPTFTSTGHATKTASGGDGNYKNNGAPPKKKKPSDFVIMKTLGSGSFSTVHLATEKETQKTYAIKILEKAFITKEGKEKYVHTERDCFNLLHFSPYIIKLFYTFQDEYKLYFVLEYAGNGELLTWLRKLGSFDEKCARFYTAEMLMALEHMHSKNIIHRDLKPENVLLDEKMHVKICDFGTAKQLDSEDQRASSFVGTAQYVSPELLGSDSDNKEKKAAGPASDLWALGCILYQLLAGDFPFRGGNDYQTFKKITALDYEIPEGFPATAKDLVEKLLVLDPNQRIGAKEDGLNQIKTHDFFDDLGSGWDDLYLASPPKLDTYLPARSADDVEIYGSSAVDADIDDLLAEAMAKSRQSSVNVKKRRRDEKLKLLEEQAKTSPWHGFCAPDELILKTGLVDKRKGLFAKRRQLILTDAPRLFYMDPDELVMKGEIPWSAEMFPQYKTAKTFFVHTPDRIYYLDDVDKNAITWVDAIQQVQRTINN